MRRCEVPGGVGWGGEGDPLLIHVVVDQPLSYAPSQFQNRSLVVKKWLVKYLDF